jgi:hypothetical protein
MNPDLESLPLRDIHLPDTVSWWPIAPGWWIIILLVGFGLALLIYMKKRKEQRELRCAGINTLDNIILEYESHQDKVKLVADLSILLRRLCISHFSRQETKQEAKKETQQKVANLTGEKWLAFLQRGIDNLKLEKNASFISGAGRVLIAVPYQPDNQDVNVDVESLLLLCRAWINALPLDRKSGWSMNKNGKKTSGAALQV